MSGLSITPAPTAHEAAAIVAALAAMGGGTPAAGPPPGAVWAATARREAVWARGAMFETWGVRRGGGR